MLHNQEFLNLYSSHDTIMFLGGYMVGMHVTRSKQKLRILLETAEEKKLLGRPRVDGRKMVERILKNSKREGLGTFGSVVGS